MKKGFVCCVKHPEQILLVKHYPGCQDRDGNAMTADHFHYCPECEKEEEAPE